MSAELNLATGRWNEVKEELGHGLPSISSATRFATDMAATRRGWVQATILPLECGKSE